MIFLHNSSQNIDQVEAELRCEAAQLLTPLNGLKLQRPNGKFAIENGAFSGFNAHKFESLLEREWERKDNCLFVAVPDVVGSARRTLEVFDYWFDRLSYWPLALVAQDGQEDLPIPWDLISTIFIGGSTKFKTSDHAVAIIKAAQAIGKWVHIGRVNTPNRWDYFEALGVDSIDGTGVSLYSHMRERINAPNLFTEIKEVEL